MLTISQRGHLMPESPIRKLTAYANIAKKKGIKVYHLNIGQPDIETPKVAIDVIKNVNLNILEYTPSNGILSLRKKMTDYYKKHQINLTTDDIIVTTGASEAIFFLMNAIADINDEVIIPEPFYANYLGFATASQVKIRPVPSKFEDNFALPSVYEFEKQISSKTKAILICNPGNPTGYLYSKKEILQLADIAREHNLYLVTDEVYREFIYDGDAHFSVMQVENFENHAVMIDSVSKRYSMCGARIGSIITKNKLLRNTIMKFAQARLSSPTYGQIAAEAALSVNNTYYKNIVNEYMLRRNVLIHSLKTIPEIKVSIPKGAFYCILSLPIKDSSDFAQWLLESFSYQGETLMIAPASGFYITPGLGKNQVRLAYVLNQDKLKRAVEILRYALKAYNT